MKVLATEEPKARFYQIGGTALQQRRPRSFLDSQLLGTQALGYYYHPPLLGSTFGRFVLRLAEAGTSCFCLKKPNHLANFKTSFVWKCINEFQIGELEGISDHSAVKRRLGEVFNVRFEDERKRKVLEDFHFYNFAFCKDSAFDKRQKFQFYCPS